MRTFDVFALWSLWLAIDAKKLPDIQWTSSNTIFDVSNTEHVMSVAIGDRISIRCPKPNPNYEYSLLYFVTEEEYSHCFLNSPRLIGACNNETIEASMNIVFREFTPTPGGFEFVPGQTYYATTTSDGSRAGIEQRKGGLCERRQMKVKFDVLPHGGHPKFAARMHSKDELVASTPVMYVVHNDGEEDDDNVGSTTPGALLLVLLVAVLPAIH